MEEELLSLNRSNDNKSLKNYVQSLSTEKICSELNKIFLNENGSMILQILFRGLSDSPKCQEKRAKICADLLVNIQKKLISSRLSNKLISILFREIDYLSTSNLVKFTNFCMQAMQRDTGDGCTYWKDLIPKLMNVMVEKSEVEENGTTMTGVEYKSGIVTAICYNEWKDTVITNIATMFIDMPLSREEYGKVVNKLCSSIQKLKLDEIPPLTYQILQLTREGNSMPLFVALAEFFDSHLYNNITNDSDVPISQIVLKDGPSLKEVQIVEGTVLYHISTAAGSFGSQGAKDLLKNLKESIYHPQFVLRPFFITLLLNISTTSYTFEEEVMGILKSSISRCVNEEEKVTESAWLESVVPPIIKVQDVLYKVTNYCYRDRDKILKGLVTLSFSLLGVVKTRGRDAQCEKVWTMGMDLLVTLIQKYPYVTNNVFENLVNQISQTHESTQYTDCLSKMAGKCPVNFIDSSAIIMQLLSNVCARLPGIVSQRVIAAVLPLTKMSPSLRDNVIIFLRKALFSDKESREMAVYGFLELLKDLKIKDMTTLSQSMSQNYVGITQIYSGTYSNTAGASSNEGMCLEILSILTQVFDYHYKVKNVLYTGVYDCFYVNPKLGPHILDHLKSRLDKFYISGNDVPPLNFQNTVSCQGVSAVIQEPIAHLIMAIALISAKLESEHSGRSKYIEVLDSLCERMSDSDIPHFGFDKESYGNLMDDSPESQMEQEKIRQVLGVYEALIGYTMCTWKQDSIEFGRRINSLFKGFSRLSDYVKTSGKTDKKKLKEKKTSQKENLKSKDKTKLTFKFSPTVLNFKCASRLLSVLNGASVNWASEESTEIIKGKRDLHRYAFNVTLELISKARLLSPSELSRSRYMLQYMSCVGRVLYLRCLSRLSEVKEFDILSAVLALECFSELMTLVCFRFKHKLSVFFTEIGVGNQDVKLQLKSIIDVVLEQLNDVLVEETEEEEAKEGTLTKKISILLIAICSFLINELPRGPQLQQVLTKVRTMCKEKKIQNPAVARALLSLLLNVYAKCKPSGGLMLDLVLCLCDSMVLIDEELKMDVHEEYAVINKKTANSCLLAICDATRSLVNEVEWIIPRFKAELSNLSFPTEEPLEVRQESLNENERELCRHLNFTIKILSTICIIAVPPGTLADSVLKEVGNFYNKLTLVTKYYIQKVTKHHQSLLNTRFEKTVKMAGHELTKNMYCFTEHIIADGSANTEDPPLKKLKRDSAALRNKVMKETKIIPKVIYEKEQFQKFVLQLSNKAKVDLEVKHSMARDYRLYAKQLKEVIERENVQLEEDLIDTEEIAAHSESTQASKRVRTQD